VRTDNDGQFQHDTFVFRLSLAGERCRFQIGSAAHEVIKLVASGPITREEKIYPTFSTPPTTFSHGSRPIFPARS
jgi:hypothetical protein